MKPAITICQYCQGNWIYSNGDDGELIAGDEDDGVYRGVYSEGIKPIKCEDGLYYLGYSDGADSDGDHTLRSIGANINYCPNCGRKLAQG